MINFFNSQPEKTFGLDISDLSLKIAKLKKKKGGLDLASFGEAKIPQGVIEEGKIQDKKILSEIIRKALTEVQGEKLKETSVICSLPEEKSFLDIVQLPQMQEEEVQASLGYEIENYIPLPVDQVYFDSEIIRPVFNHAKYTEVLIVACPKKIVDSYVEVLKMAGLKPRALEVECLAIARALVRGGKTSKPLLLIDFGQTRTTFIIFSGKSLRFTSTILISSQQLTESISKTLGTVPGQGLSLKEAEKLKIKNGLEGKKEISKAMIPPLTDLVEQIKTHLEYYRSHEKGNKTFHNGKELEKILLCGGGANLKGLVGFLTSRLRISVQLANPWVNILKEPTRVVPGLSFKKSLSYATALGLSLRGI